MLDAFSRLKLEYNSIRAIIIAYTNDGDILGYLNGLKDSMERKNKDEILYCLDRVIDWYDRSMKDIESAYQIDDFSPYDYDDHKENFSRLIDLHNQLLGSEFEEQNNKMQHDGDKKIFLSHRSTDKKYADALERFIIGLGINNNQLIYTSHPLHKIPLGVKIYDYLRENINDQVFMIILWSNDYLKSPACLSEMGAAWVMQTDYIGIYTPDFQFGNPAYHEVPVDTTKMGAVLSGDANCRASMIEFKNKIQNFFGLEDDEQKTMFLIEQFMNDIL